MDNQTYKIARELIDFTYFGDRHYKDIPLWEIRDILSNLSSINLEPAEELAVEQIVSAVSSQTDFKWKRKDLSLVGEAKVQRLLKLKGFNLRCYNLNEFPTTSTELRSHLDDRSAVYAAKSAANLAKNKFSLFAERVKIFFTHLNPIYSMASVAGIIYTAIVDPMTLLYGVIFGYVLVNCMAMIIHEGWVHDQVKGRNRPLAFLFDYIGVLIYHTGRLYWRFTHRYHHVHWKTDRDLDRIYMKTPKWFYIILGSPIEVLYGKQYNELEAPVGLEAEARACYAKTIITMNPESVFLEKHRKTILLVSHIVAFLALPLTAYICYFLIQAWFFRCYIVAFNEVVTHWPWELTREEESNTPWLFPICCGTAYHKTHHYEPFTLVLGPGWVKYFNIQYYFIKLFCKVTPGTKLS